MIRGFIGRVDGPDRDDSFGDEAALRCGLRPSHPGDGARHAGEYHAQEARPGGGDGPAGGLARSAGPQRRRAEGARRLAEVEGARRGRRAPAITGRPLDSTAPALEHCGAGGAGCVVRQRVEPVGAGVGQADERRPPRERLVQPLGMAADVLVVRPEPRRRDDVAVDPGVAAAARAALVELDRGEVQRLLVVRLLRVDRGPAPVEGRPVVRADLFRMAPDACGRATRGPAAGRGPARGSRR